VSALFDRENSPRRHPHEVDADTAEIPSFTTGNPHDPDAGYPPPEGDGVRLRPTTRARRIQLVLLLGAYMAAVLGSAWLAVLAFLRLNAIVMVLMTVAAVWLGLEAVGLARWLLGHTLQQPRPSRTQRLVAGVLAVTYAFLLADWLLHQ
jgi:hypothetical protein